LKFFVKDIELYNQEVKKIIEFTENAKHQIEEGEKLLLGQINTESEIVIQLGNQLSELLAKEETKLEHQWSVWETKTRHKYSEEHKAYLENLLAKKKKKNKPKNN